MSRGRDDEGGVGKNWPALYCRSTGILSTFASHNELLSLSRLLKSRKSRLEMEASKDSGEKYELLTSGNGDESPSLVSLVGDLRLNAGHGTCLPTIVY